MTARYDYPALADRASFGIPSLMKSELVKALDEIDRLRAENDELRSWTDRIS